MSRYFNLSLAVFAPATLFIAAPAYAGEDILFAAAPEWVTDFAAPRGPLPLTDTTAELPVIARMSDFQTRLEANRVTHYVAFELEFRQPDGLSAGDVSLSWRPEFDELTVHHVLIQRGEQVIDVLGEGQTFTVLRREQNLDAATLDGVLTANLFPSGLEVGDVLRLAYTISSANPVLAGHPEAMLGPLNGIVGRSQVRLLWPEALPLTVTSTADLPPLQRREQGGWNSASLTLPLADPLVPPAGAPARYQLVRVIEATPYANWGEVGALFVPLYQSASVIPAEGPLRTALEEIRAASDDPVVRAERALALVQDRVRYVALAMGEGGLVPADAATTWARRFGDCKAKTALLLGLLRELGIEGEPVLVSTQLGDALPGRQPMVGAFDHVIVRARVAGREYFLDGTRRGDTSLARVVVPQFSWGLPVVAGGAELVPMVAPPLELPDEEVVLRMDASGGLRVPAPVEAEVILRGDTALGANNAMAQFVGAARQQALEQFWRGRYDFITPTRVAMRYDAAAGEARITLTGTAELDWDGDSYEPRDMRVGYEPDFTRAPGPGADAPFALPHPFFNRATHVLTLPPGFSSANLQGENVATSVGGLEYRRELAVADNVFTATRTTRSIVPEMPAAEAPAAAATLEALWDKRVFLNIPPSYRASREEVSALRQSDSQNPNELVDQGNALMDAGQYSAAKDLFDRAANLNPRNEWAYANRAIAHVELGNYAAAEADIASALAISPDNWVALNAAGLLAQAEDRSVDAVKAFTRAIEADPDNNWALMQRLGVYVDSENFTAALADAQLLVERQPDQLTGYVSQMFALARLNRLEELDALIAATLARFPDEPSLAAQLSEIMLAANQEGRSEALLAQSHAGGPTAQSLYASANRRDISETDVKLRELDQALALDPDFIPALILRANTLWAEYRLTAALADANRVIELAPEFPGGYQIKGKVLIDLNRRREAEATADAMVANFPDDAGMHLEAARMYSELNRTTKARTAIARAEALAPNDETVRGLAEFLRRTGR